MKNISDIPEFLNTPSYITVHGIGRGGGEAVALKISKVFSLKNCNVINYKDGIINLLKIIFKNKSTGRVLCTAGPRDIFVILMEVIKLRRADVYLQVPYHKSTTIRDPLHFLLVKIFLLIIILCARNIFANSDSTGNSVYPRKYIKLLPIVKDDHQINKGESISCRFEDIDFFSIACRLNNERGRGSRDLKCLIKFSVELIEYNRKNNKSLFINHYGECDLDIRKYIELMTGSIINFNGFVSNWVELSEGPVIFFSKYEGFGLAAFEAAKSQRQVFVNEVFPYELILVCPKIHRFSCEFSSNTIIDQIYAKF